MEKKKHYKGKIFNKKWQKFLLVIIVILILNTFVLMISGTNFIERGIKNILYYVGIYTEEIKSVEIQDTAYDLGEEGSWILRKQARWTGLNTAEVTLDLDSRLKMADDDLDLVLVIDTSAHIEGDKLTKLKTSTNNLIDEVLKNKNNNIALINIGKEDKISNWSKDSEVLKKTVNNLKNEGDSNYNRSLKAVNEILEDYEVQKGRQLLVLFVVGSFANQDIGMQESQYRLLKAKEMPINVIAIQYEMGSEVKEELTKISDKQYLADIGNLEKVMTDVTLMPVYYEEFEIADYIANDYFYLENKEDVTVDLGQVLITTENESQKIIWRFDEDVLRTGTKATMKIKLVVNSAKVSHEGFYPIGLRSVIKAKLADQNLKNFNSNKTPVLQSGYTLTYDTNPPSSCKIKNTLQEVHYAFENIRKKEENLVCDGYQFKGYEPDSEVVKINDEVFVMPDHNLTLRGVWTKLDIAKQADGTVYEKMTLWKKIKKDATEQVNNAQVIEGTKDEQVPLYYYEDTNNSNVLLGGYCFNIVRTTDTGDVKLLYSGQAVNGTCLNEEKMLGKSSWYDEASLSLSNVGYMNNKEFKSIAKELPEMNMQDVLTTLSFGENKKYYFGEDITLEQGNYTLINSKMRSWTQEFNDLVGTYTCYSSNDAACDKVYYIANGSTNEAYAIPLEKESLLESEDKEIIVGKKYAKNSDGTYTLSDITRIKTSEWAKVFEDYQGSYVCLDNTYDTCQDIRMIVKTKPAQYLSSSLDKNYLYGNDVRYDGKNYHLEDKVLYSDMVLQNKENNYHYTCYSNNDICDKVNFVYKVVEEDNKLVEYSVTLDGGLKITDALSLMLNTDTKQDYVNTKDSLIKKMIDEWYENNLKTYDNYLVDTPYCNDRSIKALNGWDINGDKRADLEFNANSSNDLSCSNNIDKFTVDSNLGNGALTYKIGLLTKQEFDLINKNNFSSREFWLASPAFYTEKGPMIFSSVKATLGSQVLEVRPVITIKGNLQYLGGDGSMAKPYIIE